MDTESSPSVCPFTLLPGDPSSGATSDTREIAQDRRKKQKSVHGESSSYGRATTIMMLPDNVLLEIFDFYRKKREIVPPLVWKWHLLVHVCQTWRQIIFASPQRLNLQIFCTPRTLVMKDLSIWPAFPIVIDYQFTWRRLAHYEEYNLTPHDEDHLTAALEHPDRVCGLYANVSVGQLEKIAKAMQEPFPVLTHLSIISGNELVLPSGFLGGSVPRLREVRLDSIPFPALFLLSAGDLVVLELRDIPPTGSISPEAMVVSLAALPRLKRLIIGFQRTTLRPDRIHLPPVTRTVLPALNHFEFHGASKYLEDLVARIDGPQLEQIHTSYSNEFVGFQVAQLSEFFRRSAYSKLTPFRHAEVLSGASVSFTLCHKNYPFQDRRLYISVSCMASDWQVSQLLQVLSQFSATFSTVVHLKLMVNYELTAQLEEELQSEGRDNVELLHLLCQFSTVRTLHVDRGSAGHVALALENTPEEMVTEVLPSLDLIYMEGEPPLSIEKLFTARQLSGRPVTIVNTEWEFNERLRSYVSE